MSSPGDETRAMCGSLDHAFINTQSPELGPQVFSFSIRGGGVLRIYCSEQFPDKVIWAPEHTCAVAISLWIRVCHASLYVPPEDMLES